MLNFGKKQEGPTGSDFPREQPLGANGPAEPTKFPQPPMIPRHKPGEATYTVGLVIKGINSYNIYQMLNALEHNASTFQIHTFNREG